VRGEGEEGNMMRTETWRRRRRRRRGKKFATNISPARSKSPKWLAIGLKSTSVLVFPLIQNKFSPQKIIFQHMH